MNPKQFLVVGGIVLLALGIVGFLGVFSDTKSAFYLDQGENVAHTGLGIIAIAAAFLIREDLQKWLVAVVGVVALFFAVYGFMVAGNTPPNTFGISNLESPADDVLHLVVGIWALAAVWLPRRAMVASAG
ncbi:MAG TPA: hypothetical protein VF833_01205 [Gaiellaceae bacterium]